MLIGRRASRTYVVVVSTLGLLGCIELSPFETDLASDERHQTARNQAKLDAIEPPTGPLRFAVISDTHDDYDGFVELVDVINARDDVAFVVHLGDMTDSGLREEYRWLLDCLRGFDVPFFTAIGNHDTLSNGPDVYRAMFGAFNYSVDHGGVRLVVLNTNHLELPHDGPEPEWLRNTTMPGVTGATVLVAAHQPLVGEAAEIVQDNAVASIISAHFHRFAIGALGDVPAVEVGTVQASQWALFSVDGETVSVAECVSSHCAARGQL